MPKKSNDNAQAKNEPQQVNQAEAYDTDLTGLFEENGPRPIGTLVSWADDHYPDLTQFYGVSVNHSTRNPRKAELEEIRIDPPEGLDEGFVTLVTLGATINPKYLTNMDSTSSRGGAEELDFAQSNLVSNVPTGDGRFLNQGYANAMLYGRIDAAAAIEAYKKGDYEPVKEALRRVLALTTSMALSARVDSLDADRKQPMRAMAAMAEKLLTAKLPFPLEEVLPEHRQVKLKVGINMLKNSYDVERWQNEFRRNPGAPGSPERDAMLSRLALGINVSRLFAVNTSDAMDETKAWVTEELRKNGIVPPSEDYEELATGKYNLSGNLAGVYKDAKNQNALTDLEYVYTQPNAATWLEGKYMAQIKAMPAYQALLNETDPSKIKRGLEKLSSAISRNRGISGFAQNEDFVEFSEQKQRLDAAYVEERQKALDKAGRYVRDAIGRYREAKTVTDRLAQTASALGKSAPALKTAVNELAGLIRDERAPELYWPHVQNKMAEVARQVAAYTQSMRDKAKDGDAENWEPSGKTEREQYRALRALEAELAKHVGAIPTSKVERKPVGKLGVEGIQKELAEFRRHHPHNEEINILEKREIERTLELFAAIPETNTDKVIDALLQKEEQYRAEQIYDQDKTMASAVRSLTLLAAKKRFAPKPGETAAETARRHRAMKEALSENTILNNMLKLYVGKHDAAISPIEGVTLFDPNHVLNAAVQSAAGGEGATTQELQAAMDEKSAVVEPFVNTGDEQVAFYAGKADFERQFADGVPLSTENAAAYEKVQEAFGKLNETLAPFYEANEQGELPALTEADFGNIRNGYQDVLEEMGTFLSQASRSGHPIDVQRRVLMEKFRTKLVQDVIALENGKQMGMSTLPNILLAANLPTAEIKSDAETVGSAANSRLRADLPGNGGEVVKGFFTPANYLNYQAWEVFERALDRETAAHPEWKPFIKKLFREDPSDKGGSDVLTSKGMLQNVVEHMSEDVDQTALFDDYFAERYGAEYQAVRSHDFSMALYNIAKESFMAKSLLATYEEQGLVSGNLDKRNSAMTTMADMLNMPKVIAPAKSVTVKIDGKEVVGTFMAFAEGADLNTVKPGEALDIISIENMMTPEAVSSMADLQVLDYVCGNPDRHSLNMIYKLDTTDPLNPRCVGVTGIDNDFSFCANAHDKSMADIVNMKIIRKETAEALFSMKPEMIKTVLGGYDLNQQEIAAALKRIGELKQAVENGTLKPVSDDEIKKMNYATELVNDGNYFGRLMKVPAQAHRSATLSSFDKMNAAYMGLSRNKSDLGACYTKLVDANKGKFIGSSEYRTVLKGMKELAACRSELLGGRDPERVALYERKLNKLRDDVRKYEEKKAAEARKSKPSKLAQKRTATVRGLGEKLALEAKHLQSYKEASLQAEAVLQGRELRTVKKDLMTQANNDIDRWKSRGAAKEYFPKLASRADPLLAANGKKLQEEAAVIFDLPQDLDSPEMIQQKTHLYAGIIADRILQRQLEGGGEAAKSLKEKWEKEPDLFEKTRTMIMNLPNFDKDAAKDIDIDLKTNVEQFDRTVGRIEKSLQPKKEEAVKAQNAPEKQNEQKAAEENKKSSNPKL